MTRQIGRSMIVIVLVIASLIASSGVGAAESMDEISCTYSISPNSQSFGDISGIGSVSVTSPSDCNWTATSNDDWITVTSGDSGSGSGTIGYSVAANPNASSRTGTITIAGETFTVTQDGIACTYSISPTNQSFEDIDDSGNVSVTSPGDCGWTATSNDDWITVTSGDSGIGSGTVGYSVAANPDASSRTGTITIAGETFTVIKDGIDVEAPVSSNGTPPSIDYQWALSVNDGSIIPGDDGTIVDTKTQVMPIAGIGMTESEKHFNKYVVVSDTNGIDDIAAVYEQLRDQNGVAMGPEVLATDITADVPQWTEAINLAFDNNLITEAAKDDMLDSLRVEKAGLKIYVVDNFLTNHEAPGNYQVYFKVVDNGSGFEENSNTTNSIGLLLVEYMSLKAFETDFTVIDYGPILVNSRKVIAGDEDWVTADRPTIKNQGNIEVCMQVSATDLTGVDSPQKTVPATALSVHLLGYDLNSLSNDLQTLTNPLQPCTPTQIDFDITAPYGTSSNTYIGIVTLVME